MGRFCHVCVAFAIMLVLVETSGTRAAGPGDVASVEQGAVTIDVSKTGEPISSYVYGQFIEHLGRCIYGGIWAEMLEDRKFFYSVPAEGPIWSDHKGASVLTGSPWRVIGPKESVTMVREGSFVGEHMPQIELAGDGTGRGLFQGDLGLTKGKRYTARIVITGGAEAEPIEVSLVWGPGKGDRQTVAIKEATSDFTTARLQFKAGATTDDGRLEIVGLGKGIFRIGAVSLMPADNVNGMRADTLKLLKQLNSPVYRWPGGNFVSGYDWKDGIGERDKRPPRKNPAWTGVEHNDFGIHEFMTFCRELNSEPFIAVNTGLGTVESVRQEVEYTNGASTTAMGKLRTANGHPEPFRVKWWAVGNEMYGDWQLGHMPLEEYVKKHNKCAEAMRSVDPSIKLVAVGNQGKWSRGMLASCSDHMDLISEHLYRGEKENTEEHVAQMPNGIKERIVDAHRSYRKTIGSLAGKDIRIAMDEWNYWHRPYVSYYGELGCRYTLKDALGIAAGLHECFRNSDMIFMANYAQTVNVIGCIKTTKTAAAFSTTALPLKLYREHFGVIPVEVSDKPESLDVAAAWTRDRREITIGIVNPTDIKLELTVDLKGADLSGAGCLWQIAGPDPNVYNEPGKEPRVTIEQQPVMGAPNSLTVAPLSVSLYRATVW